MAKSQKHSNKEVRKPKSEKAPQALAPASFLEKAASAAIGIPKHKP
jgi:hypothetical protein